MRTVLSVAVVLALVSAGCSSDNTVTTPTPTPPPASPATENFSSAVVPLGTTAHTFVAAQAGTVDVTLTSSGPPTDVVLGVGIGIPTTSGAGCSLSTAVTTAPGSTPQLSAVPVDAGNFCIKVFDVGNLCPPAPATCVQEAFFQIIIKRP
jgi:hypothetical protein